MSSTSAFSSNVGSRAPLEVAKRHADQQPTAQGRKWVDFLQGISNRVDEEQRELQWAFYEKYLVNEKFYQGEQRGRVSKMTGEYRTPSTKANDPDPPIRTHNWFRVWVDGIVTQWTLAETQLIVEAVPDRNGTEYNAGAARVAQAVLDHYTRKLLTEEFRQRECKFAQFTGQMWRYTFWDAKAGGRVQRPQFENQSATEPSIFTCMECGAQGMGEEALDGTMCPDCGSEVMMSGGGEAEIPVISGYDEMTTGDLCCLSVPDYQLKYDRLVERIEDATYLRWRLRMRPEVVKYELSKWKKIASPTGEDPTQWIERRLKESVGNTSNRSRLGYQSSDSIFNTVMVDHLWFKPCWYADFTFAEDLPFADGSVIARGSKAVDVWPDGLYFLMVGAEPVDFRNECFTDHWQHTPYKSVPSRVAGDGIEDAINIQKEINDVFAVKRSNILYMDGGGLLANPNYIDREQIPDSPYEIGFAKTGLDPNIPIRNILDAVPRVPLPAEVHAYPNELREEGQWVMGVHPVSVGAEEDGSQTAMEANLKSQASRSARANELSLRAQGDAEWGMQVLTLWQENATDEMYIPFYGKVGELEGRFFKGADIPKAFTIRVQPRSYLPKTETDRRNDFMGAITGFGGIEGVMTAAQAAPELLEEAENRWSVRLDVGKRQLSARKGRMRIDAIKANAQMLADPSQVMAIPECEIDPINDDHAALIDYYTRWANEDEGMRARQETRIVYDAVCFMQQQHKMAIVGVQQESAQMALAAQQPVMEQQQAMGDEQRAKDAEAGEREAMRSEAAEERAATRQTESDARKADSDIRREVVRGAVAAANQRSKE